MFRASHRQERAEQSSRLWPHLVGKQHHDGVVSGAWRRVLHRERVVVILDDVEVDVSLGWTDHARSTLDPDADVTCGLQHTSVKESPGQLYGRAAVAVWTHLVPPHCSPP